MPEHPCAAAVKMTAAVASLHPPVTWSEIKKTTFVSFEVQAGR